MPSFSLNKCTCTFCKSTYVNAKAVVKLNLLDGRSYATLHLQVEPKPIDHDLVLIVR